MTEYQSPTLLSLHFRILLHIDMVVGLQDANVVVRVLDTNGGCLSMYSLLN